MEPAVKNNGAVGICTPLARWQGECEESGRTGDELHRHLTALINPARVLQENRSA